MLLNDDINPCISQCSVNLGDVTHPSFGMLLNDVISSHTWQTAKVSNLLQLFSGQQLNSGRWEFVAGWPRRRTVNTVAKGSSLGRDIVKGSFVYYFFTSSANTTGDSLRDYISPSRPEHAPRSLSTLKIYYLTLDQRRSYGRWSRNTNKA